MFTPRALYYLNQIGICPWIKRDLPLSQLNRLVILLSSDLSEKGKVLLKKMMDFAGVKSDDYRIIGKEESNFLQSETNNPLIVLNLYQDKNHSRPNIPVDDIVLIDCPSPDVLLEFPKQKKEALEPLLSLSQFLNR